MFMCYEVMIVTLGTLFLQVSSDSSLGFRVYSPYRKELRNPEEGPPLISNLNEYLSQFPNCLVHIFNFGGADFIPFQQPVALTRYDDVFEVVKGKGMRIYTVPFEKAPLPNQTLDEHGWKQIVPKRVAIITKIRPWTCEAHLFLHPPNERQSTVVRGNTRYHFFYRALFPSNLPLLHLHSTFQMEKFWSIDMGFRNGDARNLVGTIIKRWRFHVVISRTTTFLDHIVRGVLRQMSLSLLATSAVEFLFFAIQRPSLKRVSQITQVIHLQRFFDPVDCRFFSAQEIYIASNGNSRGFKPDAAWLMRRIRAANSDTDNTIWKLDHFHLSKAGPKIGELSGRFVIPKREFPLNQGFGGGIYLAHDWHRVGLLYHVFGNASYRHDYINTDKKLSMSYYCEVHTKLPNRKQDICGCGDIIKDNSLFPTASMTAGSELNFLATYRLNPIELKFVSGGMRPGRLPIQELISAYDSTTWGLLLATALVAMPAARIIMERVSIRGRENKRKLGCNQGVVSRILLTTWKTVVEQGYLDDARFRIMGGLYLLMGVVLSNAYKGENITRISSPLKPVPFRYFDEDRLRKIISMGLAIKYIPKYQDHL